MWGNKCKSGRGVQLEKNHQWLYVKSTPVKAFMVLHSEMDMRADIIGERHCQRCGQFSYDIEPWEHYKKEEDNGTVSD